jgi:hypothetical protein
VKKDHFKKNMREKRSKQYMLIIAYEMDVKTIEFIFNLVKPFFVVFKIK